MTCHVTPLLRGRRIHRLAENDEFVVTGKRGEIFQFLQKNIRGDHGRALTRQCEYDLPSDSPSTTGDQSSTAIQLHIPILQYSPPAGRHKSECSPSGSSPEIH